MKPKAIRSILALVLLVGLVLATVPAVFADGPVAGEFSAPRVPQSSRCIVVGAICDHCRNRGVCSARW